MLLKNSSQNSNEKRDDLHKNQRSIIMAKKVKSDMKKKLNVKVKPEDKEKMKEKFKNNFKKGKKKK